MPMTFPTMQSLVERALQRNFRMPSENETEDSYRKEFADFMQAIDMVEAGEIRLGNLPMDFVREADPLTALAAIMGKSREDTQAYMNNFFKE